jgi:peptide/nickel transport system permease protein
MFKFLSKRLLQGLVVMLAVGFFAFLMFRYLGDPVANMVGPEASDHERSAIRAALGLDQPFYVQFIRFVARMAQGELGVSYRLGIPVSDLFLQRLPATLELSLCAALTALFVGLPVGIYMGLHRRGIATGILATGSLVGVSLPTFLIGVLLIYVFSVELGWLPSFGRGDVVPIGWWTTGFLTRSGLLSLILPTITLTFFQTTLITRLVRSELMEVLGTDYIRFARARGIPERMINFGHALKNTLVPVVTVIGLQLGSMVAFSIITETVFQWPGLGLLFIQAVSFADVPVLGAYLMVIGLFFVAVNLVVDLLYFAIDPRLRGSPIS